MKRSPLASSHRHADRPPKPGKCEVSTSPLRYSSAPKRRRWGSRGSKAGIGRALTSIATGAVTENSSGAARFGGACVASCARAEPGSATAESPAAAKFSKRRRVRCAGSFLMGRVNPPPSFPDVQLHIVDAPPELGFTRVRQISLAKSARADLDGAGPESILPMVVMDSGFARFTRAPE